MKHTLNRYIENHPLINNITISLIFISFLLHVFLDLDFVAWYLFSSVLFLLVSFITFKFRGMVVGFLLLNIFTIAYLFLAVPPADFFIQAIIVVLFVLTIIVLLKFDEIINKQQTDFQEQTFREEHDRFSNRLESQTRYLCERNRTLDRYLNLEQIAINLNNAITEEDILDVAADELNKSISKGDCYIFVKRKIGFRLLAARPKKLRNLMDVDRIDFDKGVYNYMFTEKKPLKIDDTTREFRFKNIHMLKGTLSIISSPIVVEGEVRGFIKLDSKEREDFTYDDLRILSIVTDLLSTVLTNYMYLNKITKLADSDPLTGLYVRRYFFDRLIEEIEQKKVSQLTLMMIDIDHFKKFNDTYGHLLGDKILRDLGEFLKESTRDNDVVARYGGEEFAIILKFTDINNAYKIGERLRKQIESRKIIHEGNEYGVTISMGIAEYKDENFSPEELVKAADDALYSAKSLGRNRTITFEGKL